MIDRSSMLDDKSAKEREADRHLSGLQNRQVA